MTVFYSPGCKIERLYPKASAKLTALVMDRGLAEELSGCCRLRYNRQRCKDGNSQVCACVNCLGMLEELAPGSEMTSLWPIIDADPSFPLPDYKSRTMALQDCGRAFDRPEVHDAVRSLLNKMNINVVELEDARGKSNFCGPGFLQEAPSDETEIAPKRYVETASQRGWFVPHSDEEIRSAMVKHCARIPVGDVACYCTSCARGLEMGGKHPVHMVELLTGMA